MHYLYGNSNRCQACVRCMKGVGISKGPLCEVPLYAKKNKKQCTYICTCTYMYLSEFIQGKSCPQAICRGGGGS